MAKPCPKCQLQHQCLCDRIPYSADSQLRLTLLMHENELNRSTNTGRWLRYALPHSDAYTWQRKNVDPQLLQRIRDPNTQSVVVYPASDSITLSEVSRSLSHPQQALHFIIIDATWQEAQKIVGKSPWLSELPFVTLPTQGMHSQYQLRRNQQAGHLCTLEVASVLLEQMGEPEIAAQLTHFLAEFMAVYHADKSGHALAR
ncbi:MAG: tRNA-uridine aminocarboxypropyltransferase [Vibrio sp.]